MVQIKAQLEGKGHSPGESCNAELGHFWIPQPFDFTDVGSQYADLQTALSKLAVEWLERRFDALL